MRPTSGCSLVTEYLCACGVRDRGDSRVFKATLDRNRVIPLPYDRCTSNHRNAVAPQYFAFDSSGGRKHRSTPLSKRVEQRRILRFAGHHRTQTLRCKFLILLGATLVSGLLGHTLEAVVITVIVLWRD